jgi:YHS domain-containing protein
LRRQAGASICAAFAFEKKELRQVSRDPVCGMDVDEKTTRLKPEYQGHTYFFCSAGCKQSFDKDPQKYLGQAHEEHGSHPR